MLEKDSLKSEGVSGLELKSVQVYFVHSGLQDESLQVTISKLP